MTITTVFGVNNINTPNCSVFQFPVATLTSFIYFACMYLNLYFVIVLKFSCTAKLFSYHNNRHWCQFLKLAAKIKWVNNNYWCDYRIPQVILNEKSPSKENHNQSKNCKLFGKAMGMYKIAIILYQYSLTETPVTNTMILYTGTSQCLEQVTPS